jgi:hypothetical protein
MYYLQKNNYWPIVYGRLPNRRGAWSDRLFADSSLYANLIAMAGHDSPDFIHRARKNKPDFAAFDDLARE